MATYATLTINAADIVGADFDRSRCSAYIETNTPHGLVVVDGANIRLGGRRENPDATGTITFPNLVTTNSADNPATFAYKVTIVYVPKGSRKQSHDSITTSEFPLLATADLAAIPEAWDDVTIPVSWRSDFRAEMEALEAATEAHRTAVENVVITDLGTTDGQTKALIETDGTLTKAALSATYARGVSLAAYEAERASPAAAATNLAAWNQARADAGPGGEMHIPGGKWFMGGAAVIDQLIRVSTGASGIQQNDQGTELVFPAGSDGIHVRGNGVDPAPHGVHIGPLQVTSLSTGADPGIGIRCTDGRATLHDVAVSGFGSHGIHMKAGADYGGGNVNLSMLHTPRVYGNRGDGIRLEGSDANHITIIRPDITGNYGWGLNFEYVSSAYVLAPHIDHQYYGSPGAIRDWGDSNVCEHVYLETGDGSSNGGKILLYRNGGFGIESRYFQATFGFYGGGFEIEDQTVAHTHIIDSASRGRVGSYKSETRNGLNTYRIDPGGVNADSYALVHTPSGGADRVVTEFYPAYNHYWFGAHAVPRVHNTWDLGENSQRWRDILAQRYVRIGSIYLRDNAGVLEKSTDGASWSAV